MCPESVIARAAGIVQGSTDISDARPRLGSYAGNAGAWLSAGAVAAIPAHSCDHVAINIVIFVIVYGRMIEIYLLTSLAPIPVATLSNRELGNTGQNDLKSLFAVGFQGLLILVCVAIYAVLDKARYRHRRRPRLMWLHGLFRAALLLPLKTGSIARSVFSAH